MFQKRKEKMIIFYKSNKNDLNFYEEFSASIQYSYRYSFNYVLLYLYLKRFRKFLKIIFEKYRIFIKNSEI